MKRAHIIDVGSRRPQEYKELLELYDDIVIEVFEPLLSKSEMIASYIDGLPRHQRSRLIVNNIALSDEYKKQRSFYVTNDLQYSSLNSPTNRGLLLWNSHDQSHKHPLNVINVISTKTERLDDWLRDNEKLYRNLNIKLGVVESLNVFMYGDLFHLFDGLNSKELKAIKSIRIFLLTTPFDLYKDQTNLIELEDMLIDMKFKLYSRKQFTSSYKELVIFNNTRFFRNRSKNNA